jgi:HEAT repeat protein
VPLLSKERLPLHPVLGGDIRWYIAAALGNIGDRSVVPTLVGLLSDQLLDETLRVHIANAIGTLKEQSVTHDLVRLLSDQLLDIEVRRSIANTLGRLGERSVVPDLMQILFDQQLDEEVCRSITITLGMLGERSVMSDLMQLLSNQQLNEEVRVNTTYAMGILRERSLALELMRLLSDELVLFDRMSRVTVGEAIVDLLGVLGERSVIPGLISLLSDQRFARFAKADETDSLFAQGRSNLYSKIVDTLEQLVDDEASVQALVERMLLTSSPNQADRLYAGLWTISKRMGLNIFITDSNLERQIEVIRK